MSSFDDLKKNISKISGNNSIPLNELFSPNFMSENSACKSIDELFKKSEIEINSLGDFKNLSQSTLDAIARSFTKFNSWNEFMEKAVANWVSNQLGL